MRRQPPRSLVIDLGVLRHGATPPPEALVWALQRAAYAGEISHDEWVAAVPDADWPTGPGTVDADVLALVADVRAAGTPVALAANGTDRLPADLTALGLDEAFDVIVNSSVLGIHKPAPEFFAGVCQAVGTAPGWTMYVDTDDRVIRAARAAKLLAYRWSGPSGSAYLRAALGLR
jgi:putative hydrolase of the HAD superfamily